MRSLLHLLSKAAAAVVVALAGFLCGAATLGGSYPNPATVTSKSKVISTVTAISADTVDCDETAGYYEIPRGATNVRLVVLVTAQTGYSAGNNYFKAYLVGANSPSDTFTRVAGFATGELVTDVAQEVPTASDRPGTSVPRFVKVEWDETGSITGFTGTARIMYDLPASAGRQYCAEELGG